MTESDSRQIELIRVFCVLCMMWVHVPPGLVEASVVSAGPYDAVGAILGHTLGRIGVTTLSFISGYLMWHLAMERPVAVVIAQRFRAVMLPMLVWNAVFMALVLAKLYYLGGSSSAADRLGTSWAGWLNAWVGLTTATANRPLIFLRDLFVVAVLVRLARPLILRAPLLALAVAGALTFFDLTAPLVQRPSILMFFTLGVTLARMGLTLAHLSRPLIALPVGYALMILGHMLRTTPGDALAAASLARRAGFGFLALAGSSAWLRLFGGRHLARLGRHAYLAYLTHMPVLGGLWLAWRHWVGGPLEGSYLAFYSAGPFIAFAAAALLGRWLDRWPAALQIALRGKARFRSDMP